MANDFEEKKMKAYANRRAIMDYGMGILYAAAGIFLFFSERLGMPIDFLASPLSYIFGSLCLIYGGFRIYRGYKKNYFN